MQANIVKQDINFLDKPMWFLNSRHDGLGFVWGDPEGYEYRTGYKLPDKIDMIILFFLLLKSQKDLYSSCVEVSKREVLKGCDLPATDKEYYKRIEDSLRRWTNVSLKFGGTFYDNKKYISIGFGVIDSYKIQENKKLLIEFNSDWLLKIKESAYFKNINFELYKRLKRAVSRRLYELLIKNFKGRNECYYKLSNLGGKLTLAGRKNRRGKDVIYASDVLVAIIPAINEINKLALTPGIAEITGLASEDIFTIRHEIKGKAQKRIIYFYKEPIPHEKRAKNSNVEDVQENIDTDKETISEKTKQNGINSIYKEAIQWLDTIPYFNQKRKNDIQNMPVKDIEKIYENIRKEYERLAKEDKTPKVGWVYKAFMEKWQFSSQLEIKNKEEIKNKIAEKIKEKKGEVKKYLENNGGTSNVLYNGKKIDIIEDYGLYVIEENALETWIDIKMELLK